LVFVPSALGFAQVPGSPFATGGDAGALAFSPGRGLLATTGYDGDVSVFTVNPSTGALSAVAGSPFGGVGRGSSVAFSPGGGMLATANSGSVSVLSVNLRCPGLRAQRPRASDLERPNADRWMDRATAMMHRCCFGGLRQRGVGLGA